MSNNPKLNEGITESGLGNTGVRHSSAGKQSASSDTDRLAQALEESNKLNAKLNDRIVELELKLASQPAENSDNSIQALANAIVNASKNAQAVGPSEADNINRSTDFKNTKATVDGRSLMEAQQIMQEFRKEVKKPISIPKQMANVIGPNLAITVNGARVSIPCDGRTYYINATHWEHARERLAKLDIVESQEGQTIEINA